MEQKNQPYTLTDILGTPFSREEALKLIHADSDTCCTYLDFKEAYQNQLLAFLQGKHGLAITYDNFFKKIMNPYTNPKRLADFLSSIPGQKVKINAVLPLEGNKLVDSGSLVIMDMLVELADGSIINVEIQKIGYIFPGERSSCYVSDLIMRQYNRIRTETENKNKKFSFRDLKPVILIVIMEDSAAEFQAVSPHYIHHEQITYDSGANVKSLSKIIYVSLDTFHSVVHNISNPLEAWLTFLSSDDPDMIVQLVNTYPEFLSCYHDIMEFRRNPKELIHMFSEALRIMDRNTAQLMVEQMEEKIKKLADELEKMNAVIAQKNADMAQKDAAMAQKDAAMAQKDTAMAEDKATIARLQAEIEQLKKQ